MSDQHRARAVELREDGWSIRRIAAELDVPRATVGDWVNGVAPLDYCEVTPADETAEDRRLRTLTAWCTGHEANLPWSEFWARARWPDGTMRAPQSACKECVKARRRRRRRDDPDWARDLNRREWQRIKADPDQLAKRRELTRENGRVLRLRRSEEEAA